jgi:hypothetical protein
MHELWRSTGLGAVRCTPIEVERLPNAIDSYASPQKQAKQRPA